MADSCNPCVTPSGQGILFRFFDPATNPVNLTNVVDNNELQQLLISGNPSGGTFRLSFAGQTTAPIPAIPSPPARFFQWAKSGLTPGTYDLAVNIFVGGTASPNQLYEVFDGTTLLGTKVLNHSSDSAINGGPANPAKFADPGGLLQLNGGTLYWYPLGRFTTTTPNLSVRASCDVNVEGRDRFDVDNLRIATTDGLTVVRLDTGRPPATMVTAGFDPGDSPAGYQCADDVHNSMGIDGLGAGVRYLIDPEVVKGNLEDLPTVGRGNVSVTGDGSSLNPMKVKFLGALADAGQALLTSSDPKVATARLAAGGILPSIRKNGGSPIALPRSWLDYYPTNHALPGAYFALPQSPPLATYESVKHHDNVVANNVHGRWDPAPTIPAGFTPNSLASPGSDATSTFYFRPVHPGQYRVSVTWPADAGYSTDVVYTVATVPYDVLIPVQSNAVSTQTIAEGLIAIGNPCTISATAGGNAIAAVAVTLSGLDGSGNPVSETLPAFTNDGSGNSTVSGSQVFSRVISAVLPAHGSTLTYTGLSANPITLGTYHVNQTLAPSGAADHGVPWQVLGTYTLAGLNNGLTVVQSNGTSTSMVSDAARLERVSADQSIAIAPGDVVTYSAGDGWATTMNGPIAGGTDLPIQNLTNGTIYPPLPASVTMGVGYDLNEMSSGNGSFYFNDLLTAINGLLTWPTVINGNRTFYGINNSPITFNADNKGWANVPTGNFVLGWDGASDLQLSTSGGTIANYAPTNYPAPGGIGNRRYYTFGGDQFRYGPEISVFVYGTSMIGTGPNWNADVSNAFLIPQGVAPAAAGEYRADLLARFAGMKSIRYLDVSGAIDRNPTDFTDLEPAGPRVSMNTDVRNLRYPVHAAQQYTGPEYHLDPGQGVMILITTGNGSGGTGAHGLAHRQLVDFSGTCILNLANDLGHTTTFDLDGNAAFVYALNSTTFMFGGNGPHGEVTGPDDARVLHPWVIQGVVTNPACSVNMRAGTGFPLSKMVKLANDTHTGFYWNMSFSASDACCTAFGTFLANNLNPGLKLRLACSNEVWNFNSKPYNLAANGTYAFYGGSSGDPAPFTAEVANHQWQLIEAAWVAAGRSIGDVIRVFEGLYYYAGYTDVVAAYCHAHAITFHEFAIAPYLGNNPAFTSGYSIEAQFAPVIRRMNAAQQLDMWEFHYTYGAFEREMPSHLDHLTGKQVTGGVTSYLYPEFLGVKMVTYEGGPQTMTMPGSGPNSGALGHAMIRHPRWRGIYQHILRVYQDSTGPGTGCTLFHNFAMTGGDGSPGINWAQWAAFSGTAQLPYTPSTSQDAIQITDFDNQDLVQSATGSALLAFAARLNATSTPASASGGLTLSGRAPVAGSAPPTSSAAGRPVRLLPMRRRG